MGMEEDKEKKNQMSMAAVQVATLYLDQHRGVILKARPTFEKLAEQLTAELGHKYKHTNAKSMCDNLGMKWEPAMESLEGDASRPQRRRLVRKLAAAYDALKASHDDLLARVTKLEELATSPDGGGLFNK